MVDFLKKLLVKWPIRLRGSSKRTSDNSLSPLGPIKRISLLVGRRCWLGLALAATQLASRVSYVKPNLRGHNL